MLRRPKTHSLDLTVEGARAALADDHVHMLLLVSDDGVLHGTLTRDDLRPDIALGIVPNDAAINTATIASRTIGPSQPLAEAAAILERQQSRRLAVTDPNHRLIGLLCLKRTRSGCCNDSDVLARGAERAGRIPPPHVTGVTFARGRPL
ncbi:CBS domain-containing protein [Nocardioides sp. URHA0020]|uniref:CBS domain-containing protein n=1 Tax=Nocardioides sp. URHA0020 TaxID=1380392 RepID=UPI00048B6096|nr:CBS domain-containing protein [Nocardioides sp. URHA0020]